ncbi:PREDICTED: lymphocyte antigen 6H [Myotis davidii]|uniref:lymphocyte antigen 6H n=1 Tax=Myotis davidii TaxID=225400 RepID=UPI000767214C|nr:PREDICTED: lymphocyte antigen 6H [Myotis davidii]
MGVMTSRGEQGGFSGACPPGAGLALALAATATGRQAGGGAGGWPPGPTPSGHPPPRACPAHGLWCQDCTLTTNSSHCTPKQCQPSDTVCASVRITDPSSSRKDHSVNRMCAASCDFVKRHFFSDYLMGFINSGILKVDHLGPISSPNSSCPPFWEPALAPTPSISPRRTQPPPVRLCSQPSGE